MDIYGTSKDEEIWGTSISDTIIADFGNDTVHGRRGDDIISDAFSNKPAPGAAFDDFYFGDRGDDTLTTLSGNDRLFGGRGNDSVIASNTDSFRANGGPGTDSIELYIDELYTVKSAHGRMYITVDDDVIVLRNFEHVTFHDY